MCKLFVTGRLFYGFAIAGLGVLTICNANFPYMLIPPKHSWIPGLAVAAYFFGAVLLLAGSCIVFEIKSGIVSLVLAGALLFICCFYFLPYQLFVSPGFMHWGDWENAQKELALAGGALVMSGCFPGRKEQAPFRFSDKLTPFGSKLFAVMMICFSIDHFLYAKEAADYVPAWIPAHVFWVYFAGIPLAGSGIAILLNIKVRLIAALLGAMIFIWIVILHIPYVVHAHFSDTGGEVTSAFIAFAYSGTAFVVAGATGRNRTGKPSSKIEA